MFCGRLPVEGLHELYGKWKSVYVWFRRWAEQGVWDALQETLVELGLTDAWQPMIDSTPVRGHSQTTGARGGLTRRLLVDHAAVLRAKSMRRRLWPPSRLSLDRRRSL